MSSVWIARCWEDVEAKQGSSQPPTSFNSTFGRLLSFLTATALIQASLTFDLLHYSSALLILLSYNYALCQQIYLFKLEFMKVFSYPTTFKV